MSDVPGIVQRSPILIRTGIVTGALTVRHPQIGYSLYFRGRKRVRPPWQGFAATVPWVSPALITHSVTPYSGHVVTKSEAVALRTTCQDARSMIHAHKCTARPRKIPLRGVSLFLVLYM